MGYCVRFLTSSENCVPFQDIREQVDSLKLVTGEEAAWVKIEISQPDGSLIAVLERYPLSSGNLAESEMTLVKDSLQGSFPLSAREWLKNYLSGTRVVYTFRLQAENITSKGWPVLGRIQNLLKDKLDGIIQADSEGFYNEQGDYILWQMYEGATGAIPAALLDENGQWISFQLRLNDARAIERFKQGTAPPKGLMDTLFRR
jgi:hypothetical protein